MTSREQTKNKLNALLENVEHRSTSPASGIQIGTINGGGNIVGNTGEIHIHAERLIHKPRVVIQPGPEHISDEQRAALKKLVDEVVAQESKLRRSPKTHGAVWKALNTKMKASSYHLIRAENYLNAERFLRTWIGRLSSQKSAPAKDPDWRKKKYSYVYTNVKQLDKGSELEKLLKEKYGAGSMKDLSDDDLSAVYQTVAWWKRKM